MANIPTGHSLKPETADVFGLTQAHAWNAAWRELQGARRHADDAAFWDSRAKSFASKGKPSAYAQEFLQLANVQPGMSVFDMGCGPGSLALPLAEEGHAVLAADFSRGMLDELEERAAERGIRSVQTKQLSWQDDWAAAGMQPESYDVCFASRSIATDDLEGALMNLNTVARRRVCITLSTGSSPRIDSRVARIMGLSTPPERDYLYAFNILTAHGIAVEVRYIESMRVDTFVDFDDAHGVYERMLASVAPFADPAEIQRGWPLLDEWLHDQLIPNERVGLEDEKGAAELPLRLRDPRPFTWAFLSWNKE